MKGYKVFIGNEENFTTNFYTKVNINDVLNYEGKINPYSKGYHFSKKLEDTFRYGDCLHNQEFIICEVESIGETIEYEDEYNGYYELFVTDKLKIIRILNREEIIEYGLKLNGYRLERFISTLKLYPSEIDLFYGRSEKIDKYIDYYQNNNLEAFNKNRGVY